MNTALLHAILLEDPASAAEAGRRYLDSVDLQVIPWSQSRLLPTLYKRMADLGEPVPSLLRGTYRKAWTQNQARFRATVATIEALEAAGIPTLVLKGASLVPAYGGDWGVRDMSDVDVLVDRSQLEQAAAIIDAGGWRPTRGLTTAGVLARFATRRHSWNFEHPDGHQLDLHWRVFSESRGPTSDRAFFEAAVPLELGSVRVRRMGDADLLLHVFEHASHDESASRLQWVVDAVKVLRSTDDIAAVADRLASQASAHALVEPVRAKVEAITEVLDEPAAAALLDRLGRELPRPAPAPGSWRARLDEHQRGGIALGRAVASLADEVADGSLARRRAAWLTYVASGRRPQVEKLLTGHGGALTTTPTRTATTATPDEDGWWHLEDGPTVEALCGPGWSFPEPDVGTWVEGTEGRLSLPLPEGHVAGSEVAVELVMTVLGRFEGPPRKVQVRAAGRRLATVRAGQGHTGAHLHLTVPVDGPTVELSLLVRHPGRPIDLGISPDPRRLGVMVHRIRVSDGPTRATGRPLEVAPDDAVGTVLVTGSSGRVGRPLVARLRSEQWRVREFDLANGDDLRNGRAVLDAARGCDAVVHAGAIPHNSAGTPADIVATNVLGTWHVLEAAEQVGARRVVAFSTVQVFGFAEGEGSPAYLPVDDDHPLLGARPYGMSKRLAEDMCEAWTSRTGIPTVLLRPVLILTDATVGRHARASTPLGAFVHVDDVVEATVRALDAELEGHHRVLLCGPGRYDASAAERLLGWKATRDWPGAS
ncbi:MAG: nucleotidyltransferase family protein [Acidimicrobiia bacterium]|nr:nucleotidyltransferase family protein [Acidimicrobiia bacterium]